MSAIRHLKNTPSPAKRTAPQIIPTPCCLSRNYPTYRIEGDNRMDESPVIYTVWHGDLVEVEEIDLILCAEGLDMEEEG